MKRNLVSVALVTIKDGDRDVGYINLIKQPDESYVVTFTKYAGYFVGSMRKNTAGKTFGRIVQELVKDFKKL